MTGPLFDFPSNPIGPLAQNQNIVLASSRLLSFWGKVSVKRNFFQIAESPMFLFADDILTAWLSRCARVCAIRNSFAFEKTLLKITRPCNLFIDLAS